MLLFDFQKRTYLAIRLANYNVFSASALQINSSRARSIASTCF